MVKRPKSPKPFDLKAFLRKATSLQQKPLQPRKENRQKISKKRWKKAEKMQEKISL
jgi:hypothetical protein